MSVCPFWAIRSTVYFEIPQLTNTAAKEMVYPVIAAWKVGLKVARNHIGVILRLQVYKHLIFPAFIYPNLRHSVDYVRYLLSLNTWMDCSCCKLKGLEETREHIQNILQAIRAFHFGIYLRHNRGKSVKIKKNPYHLLKCVRGSAPALLPLFAVIGGVFVGVFEAVFVIGAVVGYLPLSSDIVR